MPNMRPFVKAIAVKPEHISGGQPHLGEYCPMALAIKEAYPDATHVSVCGTEVKLTRNGRDYEFKTFNNQANSLLEWQQIFDERDPEREAEPTTLELDYVRMEADTHWP